MDTKWLIGFIFCIAYIRSCLYEIRLKTALNQWTEFWDTDKQYYKPLLKPVLEPVLKPVLKPVL